MCRYSLQSSQALHCREGVLTPRLPESCHAQHLSVFGKNGGRSGSYLLCLLVVQPLRECPKPGLVAHAFNHSTQGAEMRICKARLVYNRVPGQPGLCRETLTPKPKRDKRDSPRAPSWWRRGGRIGPLPCSVPPGLDPYPPRGLYIS